MSTVNRKNIEDYYESEWSSLSPKSLEILIELTCKAYKLNLGVDLPSARQKPHDLGKI